MKAKYNRVKNYLFELISESETGKRLPSQTELCRSLNVSHMTVRRAMRDLEEDSLIYSRQGKGTFVKSQKKPANSSIMIIVPSLPRSRDPVIYPMVSFAQRNGIILHIFPFRENKWELLENIEDCNPGGVIWMSPHRGNYQVMEDIKEKGIEVMALNRVFKNSRFHFVSTDHEGGAREIISYLQKKGHRRIAYVGYVKGIDYVEDRLEGYRKALKERGVNFLWEGVVEVEKEEKSCTEPKDFRNNFVKMWESFSPTAIFIGGRDFAEGTLQVLKELKVNIPNKVEIAAFDRILPTYPEKCFIHEVIQPLSRLGLIALEEMEKVVKDRKGKVRCIERPHIEIKSTKKA